MKLKIEVTQAEIDGGSACFAFYCPIALAAKRYGEFEDVGVTTRTMTLYTKDGPPETFCLPPIARAFVLSFDHGESVEPFTFEIDSDYTIPLTEV